MHPAVVARLGRWPKKRSQALSRFEAAGLARVKQTIEQKVTELHFVFEAETFRV